MRSQLLEKPAYGRGNIVLIGEAAGWISPSSAEGLSYAFKSALALAESIEANPDNPIKGYSRKISYLKRNILLKNLKATLMYNPLIRKMVMRSSVPSMKIIDKLGW